MVVSLPMLALLALRNVVRALPRLAPIVGVIATVLAVMLIGNAVLTVSDEALYTTYVQNIAADLAVAPTSERSFTLFDSGQLLVGDLTTAPTLVDSGAVRRLLEADDAVRAVAGVVTAAAIMDVAGVSQPVTVLGVDFGDYAALFPLQRPVVGRFPAAGEAGILLQEHVAGVAVGDSVRLAGRTGQTFTIRELPVTGLIRYPIRDQRIETIVLADPDTARALNGYVYGAVAEVQLTGATQQLLETGIDSLFDDRALAPEAEDASGGGVVDVNALLGNTGTQQRQRARDARVARRTLPGAWNFMLVALHDSSRRDRAIRDLRRGIADSGNEVRRWWQTVGGSAGIVWALRVVFNTGLIIVAIGAAIVSSNALVLSILERRGELGTMRALGSSKTVIALLIGREALIIVAIAAAFGVLLGTTGIAAINAASFTLRNRYLSALFGGESIGARTSVGMIALHVLGAAIVGVGATAYPIHQATRVHPREAMTA